MINMSENNLKEFWDLAISQIENNYKKEKKENEFNLWFNMDYVEDNNLTIKVSVPSTFMWQSMISKGYVDTLKEYLKKITAQDIEIESVVIEKESDKTNNENPVKNEQKSSTQEKNTSQNSSKSKNYVFDEKFTFENFIVGDGSASKFAYNVALSVSQNPGLKKNPVLLYGGVGLGKTHLMKAIGNKVHNLFPEKKICCIQSESFLNEFTQSIFSKTQDSFKSKYRKLDVLLLDDIHFLQKKEGVQNELFYTFEALHKNNSQMVFTCDRPLREIREMADRLVSRLTSGMTLDLQPPNYETRKAILYKKLEILKKTLPDEVVDYIAETVETNIRDLEAALNKILGYSEFIDNKMTVDIARQQLKDIYTLPNVGNISIENIQKVIADNYQISLQELRSKSRAQKYVIPRHIALYIAKELTEYTFTELGNEFGGKDHSTVMHACDNIKDKIKTDSSFAQRINSLIKEIKEHKN